MRCLYVLKNNHNCWNISRKNVHQITIRLSFESNFTLNIFHKYRHSTYRQCIIFHWDQFLIHAEKNRALSILSEIQWICKNYWRSSCTKSSINRIKMLPNCLKSNTISRWTETDKILIEFEYSTKVTKECFYAISRSDRF